MTVVVDPTLNEDGSGITLDDIVSRIRRYLGERNHVNKLKVTIDDAAETLTLKYKSNLFLGSLMTIDDEVIQVWESSNDSVVIERGCDGTLPSYHEANALVYLGRKPRRQIVDAINDELMSLSANGLYQMRSALISNYSNGIEAYQLAELDKSNIYDVQSLLPGETVDWKHVEGWTFNAGDNAITVGCGGYSNNYRVLYKAPFYRLSDGGDDIQSDGGLQSEAADLLMWGALYRLTVGDEYLRNDFRTQGDTRRPDEVPPSAVARASTMFKSMREERLGEERNRLRARWQLRRLGW